MQCRWHSAHVERALVELRSEDLNEGEAKFLGRPDLATEAAESRGDSQGHAGELRPTERVLDVDPIGRLTAFGHDDSRWRLRSHADAGKWNALHDPRLGCGRRQRRWRGGQGDRRRWSYSRITRTWVVDTMGR
jgi:hypothetical protein